MKRIKENDYIQKCKYGFGNVAYYRIIKIENDVITIKYECDRYRDLPNKSHSVWEYGDIIQNHKIIKVE